MNVIVSSCLLGLDCRYCISSCFRENVAQLAQKYNLIPVCAEQMGGLPTPRPPVEIVDGRAIGKDGADYTVQFEKGADKVLKLATFFDCKYAVLKSRSPSCGCGKIYDGTCSGTLVNGSGITASKLQNAGIIVVDENNLEKLL